MFFRGFAAPQALVLHTLRTFMATHVLELYNFLLVCPVHHFCREVSLSDALPLTRKDVFLLPNNTEVKAMSKMKFCPACVRVHDHRLGHLGGTHSLLRLVRTR